MNKQKVQELINQEIAELHARIGGKAARKQYAPAKWQIAKLTELGIIDLMPAGFGHSDADVVIKAATTEKTAIFNAYGEGETVLATDLYKAINEAEPEVTETKTFVVSSRDNEIEVDGIYFQVQFPHSIHDDVNLIITNFLATDEDGDEVEIDYIETIRTVMDGAEWDGQEIEVTITSADIEVAREALQGYTQYT